MKTHTLRQTRVSGLALLALGGLMALGLGLLAARPAGAADGGAVTRGDFHKFAAGLARGYDIAGQAVMIRSGSDATLVSVHASGLAPNTTYGAHVHNQACGNGNGGGHYQHVLGGGVDPVNEIWPGVTTNAAGQGLGFAMNAFRARPEAQSVVIHDVDGARIACADLQE